MNMLLIEKLVRFHIDFLFQNNFYSQYRTQQMT